MNSNAQKPACMICGSREHVLREGRICLCGRCVLALGAALSPKLPHPVPEDGEISADLPDLLKS